jgi:outer membrane protein TolC
VSKKSLKEDELQAERQRDILEYLERFDRQAVVDEVRGFWRSAESAKRTYDLNTTNLQFAQRKLQNAQRLIEEGLRTNRDLLEAQREVTDAETSLLNTKVSYLLTLVSLRRAMGQDLLRQAGVTPLELPERPNLLASGAQRPPRAMTVTEQPLFGREAYPAALR